MPRGSSRPATPSQAELFAAKLRALVRGYWGDADGEPGTFPGGATLRRGSTGFVLAQHNADRALGGALAWAQSRRVDDLHVMTDGGADAGVLARRAALFRDGPQVWRIDGTSLRPADPAPPAYEPPITDEQAEYLDHIRRAGADPMVEGGMVSGEVLGLEVCRVVHDGIGTYLEVGVGKHDREAQRIIHGDRPPLEALAEAVVAVRQVRQPDAVGHQINQIAGAGWLRSVLVAHPEVVGASRLVLAPVPVRRDDLRALAPSAAAGEDAAGEPVLVVTSVGVDVDLVPTAADARLADARSPRLVIVVPEADDHPVTRALAAKLIEPAEVRTIAGEWRRLGA